MYKPLGGLYLEGRFNGGFFAFPVGGLIFGGAYFRNFTVYIFLPGYSLMVYFPCFINFVS